MTGPRGASVGEHTVLRFVPNGEGVNSSRDKGNPKKKGKTEGSGHAKQTRGGACAAGVLGGGGPQTCHGRFAMEKGLAGGAITRSRSPES